MGAVIIVNVWLVWSLQGTIPSIICPAGRYGLVPAGEWREAVSVRLARDQILRRAQNDKVERRPHEAMNMGRRLPAGSSPRRPYLPAPHGYRVYPVGRVRERPPGRFQQVGSR